MKTRKHKYIIFNYTNTNTNSQIHKYKIISNVSHRGWNLSPSIQLVALQCPLGSLTSTDSEKDTTALQARIILFAKLKKTIIWGIPEGSKFMPKSSWRIQKYQEPRPSRKKKIHMRFVGVGCPLQNYRVPKSSWNGPKAQVPKDVCDALTELVSESWVGLHPISCSPSTQIGSSVRAKIIQKWPKTSA